MHLSKPLAACIAATCALARPHDDQNDSSTASASVATSTTSGSLETITATRTAPAPPDVDYPPRDTATPAAGPAAMGARGSWWPIYTVPVAPGASLFAGRRYKVDDGWVKEHKILELALSGDNNEGDYVYLTFKCQYQCQMAAGCESFFLSSSATAPRREGNEIIHESTCQVYNARLEPSLYVPAEQKAIGGYNWRQ
ncbi:hypothetical protein RB595_004163 [Gaeumannomyces hyphopodioides]